MAEIGTKQYTEVVGSGARVCDTLEVLLLLVQGRLVALGVGLLPGLGGLVGVVVVSSRTGALAIMVLATFNREEGVQEFRYPR